jgi:hypothetical protein
MLENCIDELDPESIQQIYDSLPEGVKEEKPTLLRSGRGTVYLNAVLNPQETTTGGFCR